MLRLLTRQVIYVDADDLGSLLDIYGASEAEKNCGSDVDPYSRSHWNGIVHEEP